MPVWLKRLILGIFTPAQTQLDNMGRVIMRNGQRQYNPVIGFENLAARKWWRTTVLRAGCSCPSMRGVGCGSPKSGQLKPATWAGS
jgi:hypothetical protein